MTLGITIKDLVTILKKYAVGTKSNPDIMNSLFDWIEDEYNIQRKESYHWDPSYTDRILDGSRLIPKNFEKCLTDPDAYSKAISNYSDSLSEWLNPNSQDKIAADLNSLIKEEVTLNDAEKYVLLSAYASSGVSGLVAKLIFHILSKQALERAKSVKRESPIKILLFNGSCATDSFFAEDIGIEIGNWLDEYLEKIKQAITFINSIILTASEETLTCDDPFHIGELVQKMQEATCTEEKITENTKTLINSFCHSMKIDLDTDFFNLGSLKRSNYVFDTSLIGTDEEKQKYKAILSLRNTIIAWLDIFELRKMGLNYCIKPVIANQTPNRYSDISVKLLLSAKPTLPKLDFRFHNDLGADFFNKLFNSHMNLSETVDIESCNSTAFSLRPKKVHMTAKQSGAFGPIDGVKDDSACALAEDNIDILNFYDVVSDDKKTVVKFTIDSLSQNSMCFVPTVILLKELPQHVTYQIRTASLEGVIEGEIKN